MTFLETLYPAQTNSPTTTLSAAMLATDTTATVADASIFPSATPFIVTIGTDSIASEAVIVTAVTGNTLTITRSWDGGARAWPISSLVARTFTARDWNDICTNIIALNNGKQEKITASGLLKGNGSGGVSAAVVGTDYAAPSAVPSAYASNPEMDGTASAGTGTAYALGNHVHPSDTSRQAIITASGVLQGDGNGGVTAKIIDSVPTESSTNLISSGAVYTAIIGAIGGSY